MTFVLVHGACHGGWCWTRVAPLLRAAGHEVFTPTLTGFGDRAHLLSAEVGPATVVQDVVAVLECEELTDVVLVGHSFGALVALGVADRVPERLARLVLLDGVVVEPGEPGFAGLPPEVAEQRTVAARANGGVAYAQQRPCCADGSPQLPVPSGGCTSRRRILPVGPLGSASTTQT